MSIFILLIVFQIKHFIADYPLQNKYMLGKFKGGYSWILPLTAHAGVHFLFTLVIVLCYNQEISLALLLGLLDFVLHFCMDRLKASPKLLGRFSALSKTEYVQIANEFESIKARPPTLANSRIMQEYKDMVKSNTYFWWALGLDQMVHHLTNILIIYIMVS